MGMLTVKCESCGADINYADGVESIKCEYCGTVLMIEKSEEDKNRFLAAKNCEAVKNYRKLLFEKTDRENSLTAEKRLVSDREKQLKSLLPVTVAIGAAVWLIAGLITRVLVSGLEGVSSVLCFAVAFLLICGEGAGVYFIVRAVVKSRKSYLNTLLNQNREHCKAYGEELEKIKKEFNENMLDVRYRTPEALDFIIKALATERAYT